MAAIVGDQLATQGEARMATIHFKLTTTATPEQFVAALTDFGPGRAEIWGNTADSELEVYEQSPGHADVREGTSSIWERLDYDWSDPRHVVLRTTDSNVWGRKSGHTYTLERKPDGTTDIDVVVVREGKNIKGRALELGVLVGGRRILKGAFEKTIKAIEARDEGAKAAGVA
jgi:hypothetical protein